MPLFQHYDSMKALSAQSLAKHLREHLGQADATAAYSKEAGKEALMERVVALYRQQEIPLPGSPGWPWKTAEGQRKSETEAPKATGGFKTQGEKSARFAKARVVGTQLSKDVLEYTDPLDDKPLVNGMNITGPHYVHPYYRDFRALPDGQRYAVLVNFHPTETGTSYVNAGLNGTIYLFPRDQPVPVLREVLDVLSGAVSKVDVPKKDADGRRVDPLWTEEMKWRRVRNEHFDIIADVIIDAKGNVLEYVKMLNGEEKPRPRTMDSHLDEALAG